MAVFRYRAVYGNSPPASGTLVSDTPRQARDALRQRGLTVIDLAEVRSQDHSWLARRRRHAYEESVTTMLRDLSTLLKAGIPLVQALTALSSQCSRRIKTVLQRLTDRICAGESLAEAMEKESLHFDHLCISIVMVGENTGSLDSALDKLATFREKTRGLKGRVKTALMYPAVVCLVGLVVCMFLMTYVVPNLLATLTDAGKELPLLTRLVKTASDFLTAWWWAVFATAGAVLLAFRLLKSTNKGGVFLEKVVLRMPYVGPLVSKEHTSRMAVLLSGLLTSGLQFVEAVRITGNTMQSRLFRKALLDYETAITAGSDISAPLERSGVFQPTVVQMLSVGQQSGQLEEILVQLHEAYDHQVNQATQRLTAVLEPFMIIVLAIMVGFVAFATILPILEASNVL